MNNQPDNEILWEYMDRLRWRLRRMPDEWVADVTREIRQHLEEMVADLVAAGYSEEAAVRSAESKFGSPEKVGDRLIIQRYGRAGLWRVIQVALVVTLSHMGPSPDNPTLDLTTLTLAAAVGITFGIAAAFEVQATPKRTLSARQKSKENIITALILCGVAGLIVYFARFVSMRVNIAEAYFMAVCGSSMFASYGATRALLKRRRSSTTG